MHKQFSGRVDAAAFELDSVASSSRVADAALDAAVCSLPTIKSHFFLSSLTPNLSYITHTHEPSKYQGKMSTYSVKYKGLTWRIGHLSVH